MQVLDIKLHNSSHGLLEKRTVLDRYIVIMNSLKKAYAGTDAVLDALNLLVDQLNFDSEWRRFYKDNENGSTEESSRHWIAPFPRSPDEALYTSSSEDWGALIVSRPACYLRIIMTMDLWMCNGRFPTEAELPPILRKQHLKTRDNSPCRPSRNSQTSQPDHIRKWNQQLVLLDNRYVQQKMPAGSSHIVGDSDIHSSGNCDYDFSFPSEGANDCGLDAQSFGNTDSQLQNSMFDNFLF